MVPEESVVRLSEVIFDETLYPRKDHDPVLVQQYAETLDRIEEDRKYLCISSDKKLLDGKHRWLAYRKVANGDDRDIPVFVYPAATEAEQFLIAVRLNSKHGKQLVETDKQQSAVRLWSYGYSDETIALELSVKPDTARKYLSREKKEAKERQDERIFAMWMACYTQEEIAAKEDISSGKIGEMAKGFLDSGRLAKNEKASSDHATDFEVPIYNIWKQQTKTPSVKHFGNSDVRWVDNLLYLYTQPFDVVVDPFAGGGSTIDVCKKRFRRYWVSDIKPVVEREKEIRTHDLTTGLPSLPRWKDVSLVYLDPPYWAQSEGRYSDLPTDLANMALEDFTETLAGVITGFAKKLSSGAVIALIMQPTQWNAPDKQFTHHIVDMVRAVKLPIDMCIQAPYESQQCNAQMVEWAKANRKLLVLSREIVVWKIS